jgi:hypothetical protein
MQPRMSPASFRLWVTLARLPQNGSFGSILGGLFVVAGMGRKLPFVVAPARDPQKWLSVLKREATQVVCTAELGELERRSERWLADAVAISRFGFAN